MNKNLFRSHLSLPIEAGQISDLIIMDKEVIKLNSEDGKKNKENEILANTKIKQPKGESLQNWFSKLRATGNTST